MEINRKTIGMLSPNIPDQKKKKKKKEKRKKEEIINVQYTIQYTILVLYCSWVLVSSTDKVSDS